MNLRGKRSALKNLLMTRRARRTNAYVDPIHLALHGMSVQVEKSLQKNLLFLKFHSLPPPSTYDGSCIPNLNETCRKIGFLVDAHF